MHTSTATTLAPSSFGSIYVAISQDEYTTLLPRLSGLVSLLLLSLTSPGTLHVANPGDALSSLHSELVLSGFVVLTERDPDGTLIAQKPAQSSVSSVLLSRTPTAATTPVSTSSPSTPSTSGARSALLPRRSVDPAKRAAKKALWTLNSPSTARIDAESLLTPEDRAKPVACEPVTNGSATRRKKACKNCSCGLAEIEAEEQREAEERQRRVVLVDGMENGAGAQEVAKAELNERERLLVAAAAAPKATSSCGSCYLGDAFRCSSCPYLGACFIVSQVSFVTGIRGTDRLFLFLWWCF